MRTNDLYGGEGHSGNALKAELMAGSARRERIEHLRDCCNLASESDGLRQLDPSRSALSSYAEGWLSSYS